MFSDKHITNNKITLLGEEIITDNFEIAETFNAFFTNVVDNLDIQEFDTSIISLKNLKTILAFLKSKRMCK